MLAQAESDGLLLPNDTPFKQQQLKVWTPQLTFPCVIATYGIAALFFIILGAAIAASSNAVVTISRTYHDDPGCVAVSGSNSLTCFINLTIEKDMDAPVYFYYKLTNYYQNHRTYVKSRDDAQLRNGAQTTKNCAPLEKYGDYFNGSQPSLNDKVLYPCGLIANSFFNDKFPSAQYCPSGGSCALLTGDNWRSKGIAYSSDFHKFRTRDMAPSETNVSPFPYASTFTLPSVEDEDFMVWMRTGTTSDVVKLNKKIMHQDLKKGDQVIVEISNQYPLSVFSGEKHIILSTSSWIGTKNAFLGVAMIVLGVLSVVAGLVFAFRFWTLKRSGALSNNSPWKSSFSIGSGESQQSMTDTAGRIEQASRS